MPRELTSFESVTASPTAEPLVQRTIRGSWTSNRRAERRSVTDMAIPLVVSGGRTRTGTPLWGRGLVRGPSASASLRQPGRRIREQIVFQTRFLPVFSYSLGFSALPMAAARQLTELRRKIQPLQVMRKRFPRWAGNGTWSEPHEGRAEVRR